MTEHAYTNRLVHEHSPYLLQHAHNPVDWYPWGDEALHRAQQEDKPILLSIGYAACHWCHVMEHESFEDPETAELMNNLFVNIKVDREERPDLDSVYMAAVVALTGHGGWPMTVFLLPDGTPFYGGTYFPPDEKAARYNMPSFKQVLTGIADAYNQRRDEAQRAGQEMVSHLQQATARTTTPTTLSDGLALDVSLLDSAFQGMVRGFDPQHGGFGGAPKFPQPMNLDFLLRYHHRSGSSDALTIVCHTLTRMAHGGIYDQIGGGFHRYSVDETWLIPHFEKMLYDNALLAHVYTEAFQVTGDPRYRRIAEETLDYLVREMLHPQGGFYSTQDADSEGGEGAFFVWTPDQVREVLGEDTTLFCQIFDITRQGNFEHRSIPNMPRPLEEIARVTGAPVERLQRVVERGRQQLFAAREQRPKPARDEKVITAWNGMALRACATAAAAFERPDYLELAQRNAAFLLERMRRDDGRLLRIWKDGKASVPGYLEDYALLADGLLALSRVDGNPRWLTATLELGDAMLSLFWDEAIGGFYDSATDHETLFTRPRELSDNATPAGNSVAADVLLHLTALTGNDAYRLAAVRVLTSMADMLQRVPGAFGRLLCAADFAMARVREVALVGNPAAPDMQALCGVVQRAYRPHVVVAMKLTSDDPQSSGSVDIPLLKGRDIIDGKAAAYVCEGFTCKLPVTDAEALHQQLEE
jgi:hypothetical protein